MRKKNSCHLTKIQQQVSNIKYNVFLTASAGTGKTKTLVDRVIRLILSNEKCDDILCLTFSNTATIEMANRIKREILSWRFMMSEDLRNYLFLLTGEIFNYEKIIFAKRIAYNFSAKFNEIKIQTMHKFCNSILNRANIFFRNFSIKNSKAEFLDEFIRNNIFNKSYNKNIIRIREFPIFKRILTNSIIMRSYLEKLTFSVLLKRQKFYNFLYVVRKIKKLFYIEYNFYNTDINNRSSIIKYCFLIDQNYKIINAPKMRSFKFNIIRKWQLKSFSFKKKIYRYIDFFLTKNFF